MKTLIITILCLSAMVSASFGQSKTVDKAVKKKAVTKTNERPEEKKVKKEPFDGVDVKTMATKCVLMDTGKGKVMLEMYPESAPETVRSFLNLVSMGALDTTTFSRVVPNFVIQGGNLYTSEKLTDELKWRAIKKIPDEPNQIIHEKGIISMARSEEPNSATTSFFILLRAAKTLDGTFAAFGKVIEGLEVVETINKMKVENETPKKPVRINTATVENCVSAEMKTAEDKEVSVPIKESNTIKENK